MKLWARAPSRATKTTRRAAALAGAGQTARQRGDDEGVETLGRAAERDGAAGGEARDGRSERSHGVSASLSDAAGARRRRAKQRRVERRRNWRFAGDPRQQLGIGRIEQALEFVEFGLAHRRQIRVGETAHDEIHLAHSAPPGAKQHAPPPRVEPGARERVARHRNPLRRTSLSGPPSPGLIAGRRAIVSRRAPRSVLDDQLQQRSDETDQRDADDEIVHVAGVARREHARSRHFVDLPDDDSGAQRSAQTPVLALTLHHRSDPQRPGPRSRGRREAARRAIGAQTSDDLDRDGQTLPDAFENPGNFSYCASG